MHHVFVGAVVHPEPGVVWLNGLIVVRDGVIVEAMDKSLATVSLPEGAVVHDLSGEHVYPAFIDPYVEVETPRPDGDRPGRHWNENVTPERSVLDGKGVPAGTAESRRALGFGAAVIAPEGGVFAGSAAVVSLAEHPADRSVERVEVYRDNAFQSLDFETRGWSSRSYPTSTPGAVALMRQTLIDADWQAEWEPTLDGSNPVNAISPLEDASMRLLFRCDHELEHFLAADIAGEFGRDAVLVGNGMEFKWLDGIAGLGHHMIIPLRFPAKPDVSSVGKAESVELETMMAWEQAPTNPRRLVEKMPDVNLALTASLLPKGRDFHDELRLAIKNGLSEDDALTMLTTGPAEITGVADQVGTVSKGKRANLLVTSGPVFDKDSEFYDVWIDGVRHELGDRPGPSFDGGWHFSVGPEDEPFFEMSLDITGSPEKPKVVGTETWAAGLAEGEQAEPHTSEARRVSIEGDRISFLLDDDDDEGVTYIVSGVLVGDDRMLGTAVASDDSKFEWAARKTEDEKVHDGHDARPAEGEEDEHAEGFDPAPSLPGYPFGPYAVKYEHPAETILVNNATLWTSSDRGRFEPGWLLIRRGRIMRAEPGEPAEFLLDGTSPEIVVIDATGKHVTPGLVDAHSHTSLFRFGVNESGQTVTAEVRIGDSLDPGHINWYRQLAMGVTTVNSLHGSANPIGGQNQVHKVRWGATTPTEMQAYGARPGIKFALGENVKQSNWASDRTRYPQTRMGVETIIRDRFQAAREYLEGTKARSHEATKRGRDQGNGDGQDISRSDRVAKGDESGTRRIRGNVAVAGQRAVWDDLSDATGGRVRAVEHRGGIREAEHHGLRQVSQNSTGIIDGVDDAVRTRDQHGVDAPVPGDRATARRDRSGRAGADSLDPNQATYVTTPASWLRGSVAPWLSPPPPRRDLELEALAQILAGERLVHCHSYRQDEILMLCRVAEDFGFQIGSFQHGLEVYKVAEAVREHAIGASLFSDWWTYKIEVMDAIPFAGPLQTEAGVSTSYNSDSDELARRLNTEAAKAVKYARPGKMTEEDALKFVTINAANQIGAGHLVGSLEEGKDADFVIWSDNPLSTRAVVENVYIDGREYYSLEQDRVHRELIARERQRLIQKIVASPKRGEQGGDDPEPEGEQPLIDGPPDRRGVLTDWMRAGFHPDDMRPGDCGCGIINHAIYYEQRER